MYHKLEKRKFNYTISRIVVLLAIFSLSAGCSPRWEIVNPYENKKEFPYKASLHNHSHFHPEWAHARVPSDQRLRDYRDYKTDPEYGIVAITEHERITTPWNTVPTGVVEGSEAPWGVEGILWIPGNETIIGHREREDWLSEWQYRGGIFGEVLVINASTKPTDEIDWSITESKSARSGWLYKSGSRSMMTGLPYSIELRFTGIGLTWIARTDRLGGISAVYLDGEKIGEANLYSPVPVYNKEVFSIDNLENKKHSLRLVYERKGDSDARHWARINMDMLIVKKADGQTVEYGAQHPSLVYQPYRLKHEAHPRGEGQGVEEPLRMLSDDRCFLVLAHPNSRLETEGEYKGRQLWPSAGYTYDELDILFGNKGKGIPSLSHPPHALEIGNLGYDFSPRTGFQNAEDKWDYLLEQGHRVLGVATDDSHGVSGFRGWVVVYTNASTREELTIDDVMESLFSGNFYSSSGPNMDIELKSNKFTIKTDQPSLMEFISKGEVVHQESNAVEATYTIQGDEVYVRGRVTREDPERSYIDAEEIGHRRSAWTNPLYITPR